MTATHKQKQSMMRGKARKRSERAAPTGRLPSAERAHSRLQKSVITDSPMWWRAPDIDMPACPLPGVSLPDAKLPAAKLLAIAAVHEFGVWVEASRASGMGRFQLLRHMKGDAEFRASMLAARRECFERLEREMIRRGQFKGGDLAGIFTLKHNVGKYREVTRLELTGKDGAPFNALESAKADILTRLAKLAEESAGSREGLEGKQEIVVGSRRPQLVKGAGETEVKRSQPRRGKD